MSIIRAARGRSRIVLAALFVCALAGFAPADELADFHGLVERATAQYRVAMTTLETQGQAETAAAVHRFREAWQEILERFGKEPPAPFAGDEQYSQMFTVIDARLVGVLLVIDMGNRDAARAGLAPIQETLSDLSARSAPAKQP
jgi:hypothetical protein